MRLNADDEENIRVTKINVFMRRTDKRSLHELDEIRDF